MINLAWKICAFWNESSSTMPVDIENDAVKINYISGYASLANFIASDADHSSVIFKRFDRLSARNLLYMQSELAELQAQQDEYDRDDAKASRETQSWQLIKESARDWKAFEEGARSG